MNVGISSDIAEAHVILNQVATHTEHGAHRSMFELVSMPFECDHDLQGDVPTGQCPVHV